MSTRTVSATSLVGLNYSSKSAPYITTSIAGRYVNPAKLETFLDQRFEDNYTVEMSRNIYQVTAPRPLTRADIRMLY
ncbi:hypothetical protein EDB81DRAFT_801901 [Dactylonectria macrodidyma]|uniref:Uncharacterized protein n=1 Tax=Dactylonectria macrodidyma TaxID=307937 RepID=A0A9P9EF46_9HYPO|nr:hypothetical protein EDB81DRAFT_801901 [Dactylonectria macrodidyma]